VCVCYQSRRKKKKNFEECYTINDEEKYEFIKPSEKPKKYIIREIDFLPFEKKSISLKKTYLDEEKQTLFGSLLRRAGVFKKEIKMKSIFIS